MGTIIPPIHPEGQRFAMIFIAVTLLFFWLDYETIGWLGVCTTHLETEGELPGEFEEIRDRLMTKQSDSDKENVHFIFDIPIELARALTGFGHNRRIPGTTDEDDPYERLEAIKGTTMDRVQAEAKRGKQVAAGCVIAIIVVPILIIVSVIFLFLYYFVW